jgi:hypothetical protein
VCLGCPAAAADPPDSAGRALLLIGWLAGVLIGLILMFVIVFESAGSGDTVRVIASSLAVLGWLAWGIGLWLRSAAARRRGAPSSCALAVT